MSRTLHFMLEVEASIDEGETEEDTIVFVTNWLAENRYDSRLIGSWYSDETFS